MSTKDSRTTKFKKWTIGGTIPGTSTSSGVYSYQTGTYAAGADDPNWKLRVERLQDATNGYTKQRVSISYMPTVTRGTIKDQNPCNNRGKYRESSRDTGPVIGERASADVVASARAKAAVIALSKINKVNETFSGQQFLGEFRETVKMIKSPLKSLRELTGQFLKKSEAKLAKAKPKDYAKTAADTWLELSFGANPLISDIGAIANAALELSPATIRVVRAIGAETFSLPDVPVSYSDGIGATVNRRVSKSGKVSCLYVCGVKCENITDLSALMRVVELSGVKDINNLVPTVYELIPYTWLVDYFTNCGQVLGAAFVSTANVSFSSRTTFEKIFAQRYGTSVEGVTDLACTIYTVREPGSSMYSAEYILREAKMPSASMESLHFKMPSFTTQWLNLGALSTSLFLKG
nr:MAG: hypothetical protein 1 [Leviviridae sp.]